MYLCRRWRWNIQQEIGSYIELYWGVLSRGRKKIQGLYFKFVLILIIRFHYSLIERTELYDFVFIAMCSIYLFSLSTIISFNNFHVVYASKTKSVRLLTYIYDWGIDYLEIRIWIPNKNVTAVYHNFCFRLQF